MMPWIDDKDIIQLMFVMEKKIYTIMKQTVANTRLTNKVLFPFVTEFCIKKISMLLKVN